MNLRRFYTTQCWRKTALGSEISLSSSQPLKELQGQNPIIIIGGVHGDEPEGVELASRTLTWLTDATEKGVKLAPWILIPCLNVDGYAKRTRGNGRGVDLNRNYPSKDWTATYEKERYFPGPSPASEPEVAGVVELMQTLRPRLMIHCHSWEPCIVYTGDKGLTDAKRLSACSGYELKPDIGYPTPGSLSRYGWHDNRIPIICIEEQEHLTDLSVVWPHFSKGMSEILQDTGPRA